MTVRHDEIFANGVRSGTGVKRAINTLQVFEWAQTKIETENFVRRRKMDDCLFNKKELLSSPCIN